MSSTTSSGNTDSTTSEERAAQELLERLRAATLGEYEVLGELGRGGMATVFLAHEISLDRKVAIKVMNPSMVHGMGMVERFKREARTAANLSHPHIIPIYSVREVDGLLFCVIKLVQGTALDLVMKELGQLPVAMVHGILAQVGSALGYAHRHGVVHRDIKPGNILIDDEGWAVVTDFGIAKVADAEVRVTSTGMAIGTPAYMSPEQATADEITGASDQYSLGIVAYEMLTGRTPFTGSSLMAIMYSHFHDAPPAISGFRTDVPDQLCNAIMRMLRKAPADRWPSIEDAIAAAGSQPLAPGDPTRTQLIQLAKTGLTHRLVVQTTTPRSPIPKLKNGKQPGARRSWLLGAGGVALAVAGFFAAKVLTAPATITEKPAIPAVVSKADSVPAVQPRPDSTPPGPSPSPNTGQGTNTPRQVARQEPVPPAPPTGRQATASASRSTEPVPQPPPANAGARPDSSGSLPVQKAESTVAPPPVVSPPPVSTSTNPGTTPTSISRPADPQAAVVAVIQSYARALAAGDLEAARRIYPTMPNDQRQGLEALWRGGGGMSPNWTVSDVIINGDVATARVRGNNAVVPGANQTPQSIPVSLRASLQRRNNEWRLVALIN